ncbi:hypothetical protein [Adhaeribacter pallidiroseus]|uniref:Uncharacterized protein n=1 Tax=Adhaeribacter pallidiroseus TaxID=2072847 RepID=A0A369QEE0_9BACT|nr:hypothetical protein [Adhaeribacter pallidiroseus]RDC63281.1 hypothetical protein AHMF7616_01883 [Adhaeribacter pallidiroseus]
MAEEQRKPAFESQQFIRDFFNGKNYNIWFQNGFDGKSVLRIDAGPGTEPIDEFRFYCDLWPHQIQDPVIMEVTCKKAQAEIDRYVNARKKSEFYHIPVPKIHLN